MVIEIAVSPERSDRAQFWRETAEKVLTEAGVTDAVSHLYLTDRPGSIPGLEAFGQDMESVALAVPILKPEIPILLDIVESDKLLQGEEEQKAAVAAAIVREEGFHARDFSLLSRLPRERLAEHVDAEGRLLNTHGLHSLLEIRVLEDHLKRLDGLEGWFLAHYKVPWTKHIWNGSDGLRNRLNVFRKRHTDLAWAEANTGALQDRLFRFAEGFIPLRRHLAENPDIEAITRFAEWNRVKDAVAAFETLFEEGFRTLPEDGTALSTFSLAARVQEEVVTPWLQQLTR